MDGTADMVASAPRRRWRWIVAALVATIALLVVAASLTTLAWAGSLRDDGRLLPGTTIASVDVSSLTVADARAAVDEVLAAQLDRPLTVTYEDLEVTTSARELGASTDLDQALADATARVDGAGFRDLVRARWLGAEADGLDLAVLLDDADVTAFVAEVAGDIDRDPRDAEIEIDGTTLTVVDAATGREVDVTAASEALAAAAADPGADAQIELPVAVTDPGISTERATDVVDATEAAVDAALDRAVTLTLEGDRLEVTARDLEAVVDRAALVTAGLDGDLPGQDDVTFTLDDGRLRGAIDDLASGKETAARDAELRYRGGDFDVTAEQVGAAVDRGAATTALRDALSGERDAIELELDTVTPRVTASSFGTVVVAELSERTVALYRDGERVREWPVAVGASSSPTPTGQFTIGAKRFEPTWVNPAPDRWGADMPARIGPGPDNPLGARALNWNDASGRDTLIRFHGTPNEGSIGSATSNGCVRMFNQDVVELFDLVSTGTVVVSVG